MSWSFTSVLLKKKTKFLFRGSRYALHIVSPSISNSYCYSPFNCILNDEKQGVLSKWSMSCRNFNIDVWDGSLTSLKLSKREKTIEKTLSTRINAILSVGSRGRSLLKPKNIEERLCNFPGLKPTNFNKIG